MRPTFVSKMENHTWYILIRLKFQKTRHSWISIYKHRSYLCCSSGYKNIMAEWPWHQHRHNPVQQPPVLPSRCLRGLKSHHSSQSPRNSTKVAESAERLAKVLKLRAAPASTLAAGRGQFESDQTCADLWLKYYTDGPPSSFFSTFFFIPF